MTARAIVLFGALLGALSGASLAGIAFGLGAAMTALRVLVMLAAGTSLGTVAAAVDVFRDDSFYDAGKRSAVGWAVLVSAVTWGLVLWRLQ